jgi:hypothetical protein
MIQDDRWEKPFDVSRNTQLSSQYQAMGRGRGDYGIFAVMPNLQIQLCFFFLLLEMVVQ